MRAVASPAPAETPEPTAKPKPAKRKAKSKKLPKSKPTPTPRPKKSPTPEPEESPAPKSKAKSGTKKSGEEDEEPTPTPKQKRKTESKESPEPTKKPGGKKSPTPEPEESPTQSPKRSREQRNQARRTKRRPQSRSEKGWVKRNSRAGKKTWRQEKSNARTGRIPDAKARREKEDRRNRNSSETDKKLNPSRLPRRRRSRSKPLPNQRGPRLRNRPPAPHPGFYRRLCRRLALPSDITVEKSGLEKEQGLEPPPSPPPRRGFWPWSRQPANYRYLTNATIDAIRRAPVQRARWKFVIVHNSGTRQGNARAFDYYHRKIRRMRNGLAYHFVIGNGTSSRNGQIEIGDRWRRQINGGHVHSDYMNNIGLGICLVGDFNRDQPTRAQLEACEELIRYLRERCGQSDGRSLIVRPHREVNPPRWATDCPGDAFPYGWFGRIPVDSVNAPIGSRSMSLSSRSAQTLRDLTMTVRPPH